MLCRFGPLPIFIALFPSIAWSADEDLLFAEIPTVYAATRHVEPISEVPAAVTIITRDDIRKYGYRTLTQALESVPGFYVSDDHAITNISHGVRRLSLPTDYNARILFLLNGLPFNDMYLAVRGRVDTGHAGRSRSN